MDDFLVRRATGQHGLVTTAQALSDGYDRRALQALVVLGTLVHLGRGLYCLSGLPLSTEAGRHEALARGGLMLYPDAVLSHSTAIRAHGLPTFADDLHRARLLRPLDREVLTQSFVMRPRRHETVVHTDWGPAVSVADAVVQMAMEGGTVPAVVAGDAALHERRVSAEELSRCAESVRGWPGSSRVNAALGRLDSRSESVGESRLRLDLAHAGIAVTPQVNIRDERGRLVARVDFVVDDESVIVEFDGLVKYREGGPEALIAEKRREDDLRRLGYVVVRVIWSDLYHPAEVVARVRNAIAMSRRYGQPALRRTS